MARTALGRREAYSNIAVGSAVTTQERVLPGDLNPAAGALPPTKDRVTFAHGENLVAVASASLEENMLIATDPVLEKMAV
jgi:hypothetical protein